MPPRQGAPRWDKRGREPVYHGQAAAGPQAAQPSGSRRGRGPGDAVRACGTPDPRDTGAQGHRRTGTRRRGTGDVPSAAPGAAPTPPAGVTLTTAPSPANRSPSPAPVARRSAAAEAPGATRKQRPLGPVRTPGEPRVRSVAKDGASPAACPPRIGRFPRLPAAGAGAARWSHTPGSGSNSRGLPKELGLLGEPFVPAIFLLPRQKTKVKAVKIKVKSLF